MTNVVSLTGTAEILRLKMDSCNVSPSDVSSALAIPEEKVQEWLNGTSIPNLAQLYTIAHGLLDCPVEDVLAVNDRSLWLKG